MLQEKNTKKLYIIMVAVTAFIGATLFLLLLKRPLNNYTFDVSASVPDVGRVENDGYYFDMPHGEELTEENQKVFLNIPQTVKAGSYTIRIGYRSNAGSTISVTSRDNPWVVKCDQIALSHLPEELPGEFNMNYGLGYLPGYVNSDMYITKDVSDLDVYAVYCGYQDFYIQSVELIGNRNYVKTIWLSVMFMLVAAELIVAGILNGFFKSDKGISLTIIAGITLLSCIPLLFKMGLRFDDGIFLYGKINGLIDGIRDGQFPVRIHPNTLKGFGYALSYFYPELFLYPFAIMRGIGFSLRFCVYALIFCINFATVSVGFICVKRVIKRGNMVRTNAIAGICAFLYTFNTYRLLDVYSRGAMAEVIAIIFLPLVVTGLYVIIAENGNIAWLTAGLVGLVNSHILSCELVALFAILLCVVCFKMIFNKETFIKLLKSCGITAMLSAYFLVPFLYMSSTDSYRVYAENAYDTSMNMLSLQDILGVSISSAGKINNGTFFNTRYTLGVVIVLLSVGLFMTALMKKRTNIFINICFAFGIVSLWLSSSLFPWKVVENIGGIIRTVFCMVQFPWRYLSVAMVCFMFVIAGCIEGLASEADGSGTESSVKNSSMKENGTGSVTCKDGKTASVFNRKTVSLSVIMIMACALVFIQAITYFATLKDTASDEHLIFDGAALNKYNVVGMGEYEPVNFDDSDIDHSIEELQYIYDENIIVNGTGDDANKGLAIGPLSKSGTESSILIINPTEEEKVLYMPITYYEGYRVENVAKSDDGTDAVPVLFETEHGTVGLKVPAHYYNGAHITYNENILCRISELISVLTLAGLAMFEMKKNKNEAKRKK